ncbi:hypothetical protein BRC83_08960 [Halobacteriales archaeon QS_1_68_17]|nr:MAG: hypothetical protein BRC83_08960 [Halobacteriales archaeon QS_1_68_17]
MGSNPAASAGVVVAGVALVASFLGWPGDPAVGGLPVGGVVNAAVAGVALAAFLLRRHGVLGRVPGAALAGVASLLVVGFAASRVVAATPDGGTTPALGAGVPVAVAAGALAVVAAAVDGQGLPRRRLVEQLSDALTAAFVGLVGFLVGSVFTAVVTVFAAGVGRAVLWTVSVVGFGVGLAAFVAAYLRVREYDVSYVDLAWPDARDLGYAVAGTVALLVAVVLVSALFRQLGLPTATSSIERTARSVADPDFLLVLVPLSWLVVGPGEELVFRNIVQKSLYESFSPWGAVVVASAIFALVHVPQYYSPNFVAMASTLAAVFLLALILGATYYLTENLLVPILIHGSFNAVQFLALYVRLATDVSVPL